MDLEYRTWCAAEGIDPEGAPLEDRGPDAVDAYQAAVAAGTLDPRDDAARAAFVAEWRAAHPEEPGPVVRTPYTDTSYTETIRQAIRAQWGVPPAPDGKGDPRGDA